MKNIFNYYFLLICGIMSNDVISVNVVLMECGLKNFEVYLYKKKG